MARNLPAHTRAAIHCAITRIFDDAPSNLRIHTDGTPTVGPTDFYHAPTRELATGHCNLRAIVRVTALCILDAFAPEEDNKLTAKVDVVEFVNDPSAIRKLRDEVRARVDAWVLHENLRGQFDALVCEYARASQR